ncbi:SDR family NAD(P)-dependent oxidoreductase [Rhizobium sp. RAF36]|uniref:SDR family NAD(P)-dependent oxidoreductase n=1 Tax=Rhizobium sp. RAF36 TaxID=3233055 RepID=UPI003F95059B
MTNKASANLRTLPADFRAIVIGASGGIGGALCEQLSREPGLGELITLSRSNDGFDLLEEATVADHASHQSGKPIHLLVCATGALTLNGHSPEKSLRQLDPDVMAAQFRINAIGPALVAKHFLPLLDRKTKTVAVFLSARVGSIGDNRLGGWISYRSSKAALNQIVRTASIEVARTHPRAVVAALHPGTVRTNLSAPYSTGHRSSSAEESAFSILQAIDGVQTTGSFIAYDGSAIEW